MATTLTLRKIGKKNIVSYGRPGIRGVVRFHGMFAIGADIPQTIDVGYDAFIQGSPEATAKAAARAERKAKRDASLQERAAKAAARAQKAVERANKLVARANKTAPAVVTEEAQAEPVSE